MSQGTTIKGKTPSGLNLEIAVDANGNLIISNSGSAVPVTTVETTLTERYDVATPPIYYSAIAPLGTADGSTGWTITKYDLTSLGNASGKTATNVSWTNRATGTYT